MDWRCLKNGFFVVAFSVLLAGCAPSGAATTGWSRQQWADEARGIRTTFNPDADLNSEELTLRPGNERWLDFVYWTIANGISNHELATGVFNSDSASIALRLAPGTRWETTRDTPIGFVVGHLVGEYGWRDVHFPEFFEKHGGVYGVSLKDRLSEIDPESAAPWVEFFEYIGDSDSRFGPYLFQRAHSVDAVNQEVYFRGGHGTASSYTFQRYFEELRDILTDASIHEFLQMYDTLGSGFASRGNWAGQGIPEVVATDFFQPAAGNGSAVEPDEAAKDSEAAPAAPPIPDDHPMAAELAAGRTIYERQCASCHGTAGNGEGVLAAALEVKPRDFTPGIYKFRITETGEFPTLADIERTIRIGVAGSTMPAWGQFLNGDEIRQLALYVTLFSEDFTEALKAGEEPYEIEMMPKPDASREELLALGEEWAALLECSKCHGTTWKGDGPSAAELMDNWNQSIKPTDLTYKWTFKNGHAPEDIYRTFVGGLSGTPMPSYADALSDARLRWALVEYFLSLSPEERPAVRLADFKERIPADLSDSGQVKAAASH